MGPGGAGRIGSGGRTSAVVRVAVGRPGGGIRTHTLLSVPDRKVAHMTVALDRFGEATVAWVEQLQENGRHGIVDRIRAVYHRPSGHWSAIQILGGSSAFTNAAPRVASAPDGTVALTYYAGSARPGAMSVAWRTRGRAFGTPRTLGGDYLTAPTLAFDSAGTMYLAGTRRCDARSQAVLYRATPARRRSPDAWLIGDPPVRASG